MIADTRRERKVVTVLFCDLVGFTARAESLDPEDVADLLSGYHATLRTELERRGGTVEKFIGDAVMALFGAPIAHEDDPERALRAALAIRDWARESEGVEVRVAVNTGEALEQEMRDSWESAPAGPWKELVLVCLDRDFTRAAEIWAEAGSRTWEALLRLRAAEVLIEAGRRAEGTVELQKALAFYRTVGATFYVDRCEALLREEKTA